MMVKLTAIAKDKNCYEYRVRYADIITLAPCESFKREDIPEKAKTALETDEVRIFIAETMDEAWEKIKQAEKEWRAL